MANTAVVAGRASLVDAREHGRSADGHHTIVKIFGEGVAEILFNAGHLHRRKKFSVGKLGQALGLAADAGELFHVVVPGRDVRVADRPIRGDSIFQIRFKVEIAPTIALASPGDGFSAHLAAANPGKLFARIRGIGIVHVIDEKFVGVFIASVVALALDGLRALAFGAIVPATVLEFPYGNVLDVVALGNDRAPRFEDQGVQTFFSELFRRPAASDSRANDDCVVGIGCHVNLPYAFFSAGNGAQPCWAPGMISRFNSCEKPISEV